MEVKNGIIIDGELHEATIKSGSCDKCSVFGKLCNANYDGLCDYFGSRIFVNRGKVKVEKVETEQSEKSGKKYNSVWHNAGEMPQENRYVLLERDGGNFVLLSSVKRVFMLRCKRWAYVEDLTPNTDEE